MTFEEAAASAEAILFTAGEPVPTARIAFALDMDEADTREALTLLGNRLEKSGSAVKLVLLGSKAQLCARAEYADAVRKALETRKPPQLSPTAIETLTVIAYRQPCTRSYIEQVRGVDSAYTVYSLTEKGFIEESGRLEVPGRPILYRTTDQFLRVFGLASLKELPPLPEGEVPGQLPLPEVQESGEPRE